MTHLKFRLIFGMLAVYRPAGLKMMRARAADFAAALDFACGWMDRGLWSESVLNT